MGWPIGYAYCALLLDIDLLGEVVDVHAELTAKGWFMSNTIKIKS